MALHATEQDRQDVSEAIAYVRKCIPRTPEIAIICGSGLADLDKIMEDRISIPYHKIPGFPQSTVAGHKSELVCGTLGDKYVIMMRGRFHYYEGYSPSKVVIGVRVMAAFAKILVVTNAAGAINTKFKVGDIMVIRDHIHFPGLAGIHPLRGPNDERFGERFPAGGRGYNQELSSLVKSVGSSIGLGNLMHEGVYAGLSGPSYETPHELQAIGLLGGDSVGMSTTPEVITASHCGMEVLGLSLITNICLRPGDMVTPIPSHEEVLAATKERTKDMETLVKKTLEAVDLSKFKETKAHQYFVKENNARKCPYLPSSSTLNACCRDLGLVSVAAAVGALTSLAFVKYYKSN